MRYCLILLLLAFFVAPLTSQGQQTRGVGLVKKERPAAKSYVKGKYRALLIGNNDYQAKKWPSLKTAIKDVTAIAEVLRGRYGFDEGDLIVKTNATRKEMLAGFNQLAASSGPNDNVLIYYAGHGEFDDTKQGWWVPVDGKDNTDYISNDEILGRLRAIKAKHKLLIADSCFSGNLLTRGVVTVPKAKRLPSRYVVEKTSLSSVQGLSSGGNEPVSDGGAKWGGHSIFAYHLLGQLRANQKPYFSAHLLGYKVSEQVANDTASLFGTGQTPVFSAIRNQGDQGGDFFFAPDSSTLIASGAKVALMFARGNGDGANPPLGLARELIAERLRDDLKALYVPLSDGATTVPADGLEQNLPALIREADAETALVIELSGKMKKQPTLMWQGHSTLTLKLRAYRMEKKRLVAIGNYELETQRLPIRKWPSEEGLVEEQFRKTAAKILKKTSQRKLNEFLESVRN